jgi:hypothetical protein
MSFEQLNKRDQIDTLKQMVCCLRDRTQGVYRSQYVPAGSAIPRTTNGASDLASVELVTNDIMIDVRDFDPATEEAVGFWTTFGDHWDGGTIKVKLEWTATGASTFDVVWGVSGRNYADDDPLDAALGTEVEVTDTLTANDDFDVTDATAAITLAGAAGDSVYIQIARKAADGADTLDVDARLKAVHIQYKESGDVVTLWA